ncbi:MAG TPA: insulinase family protein, partial [Chryseolinea sp.]|nr:insulinase family protein [Chryseolinea sp.]
MNNVKNIIVLICISIVTFPVLGQKQTPPPGGKPKDFVLPEKKVSQLKNGLKSTMVQYGSIPKVTVNLIIKTGNVNEG